jgi:hypothetical protein
MYRAPMRVKSRRLKNIILEKKNYYFRKKETFCQFIGFWHSWNQVVSLLVKVKKSLF